MSCILAELGTSQLSPATEIRVGTVSPVELETKVHAVFTIMEKAPTKALSKVTC